MNYSFEYIDIILLAMIAGFIFLRLRGILGKRTGHEENLDSSFAHDFALKKKLKEKVIQSNFDGKTKENFLQGAKMAYETIITDFSKGNLKEIKSLLDKKVFDQFDEALKERKKKSIISESFIEQLKGAQIHAHYLSRSPEVPEADAHEDHRALS